MGILLESLSKEIGSSINKPLPSYNGCEFREDIAQITRQNTSEMTTKSTDNESIMAETRNDDENNGNNSSSTTITNNIARRQKTTEMKIASCSHFYPCKYCCQIDLFVMFSYTIVAILDSCFRLGHSALVGIECRLYKMLRFYLDAYRNQSTNMIQRIIKGLCTCFVAIFYIEVYITTGLLKFILNPIPQWIAYQIHGLLFKFHSNSTRKDHDFNGLNSNENTS